MSETAMFNRRIGGIENLLTGLILLLTHHVTNKKTVTGMLDVQKHTNTTVLKFFTDLGLALETSALYDGLFTLSVS